MTTTKTTHTPYFIRECFADNGQSDGWAIDIHADGSTFAICFSEQDAIKVASALNSRTELLEALEGLLQIGKRDMSNPKYDGYFEATRAAVAKARGEA